MYDGSQNIDMEATSVERLPLDFLRLLFARLSARDLCAAACTCHLWNELTKECWRDKTTRRWRHGTARWAALTRRNEWKRVYRERHLLDCNTRAALRDLPWPVRREGALAVLVAAGDDAADELLAAVAAATALPAGLPACTSPTRGLAAGLQAEPGAYQLLGRRYWAELALAALRKRQAVQVLSKVARSDPQVAQGRPDRGALAIAQAHYPTVDLAGVEVELDALGGELRRRMEAAGTQPGSMQALHILIHLLFGPPTAESAQSPAHLHPAPWPRSFHRSSSAASVLSIAAPGSPAGNATTTTTTTASPGRQPPSTSSSCGDPSSSSAAAGGGGRGHVFAPDESGYGPSRLLRVVGADGGLGLRGCSDGVDYYNPSNSMLCDVLSRRRGIPISLAVVMLAVAARGGLGGRLELIGLPSRVVNRFIPAVSRVLAPSRSVKESSASSSSRGGGLGGVSGRGGGGEEGGGLGTAAERIGLGGAVADSSETFIDVFDGGALLSFHELRSKLAGLGVVVQRGNVVALTPAKILERMNANLYGIYRDAGDLTCLRLALELRGAVADNPRDLWSRRYRVSLALEDWADAAECLDAMGAGTLPPAGANNNSYNPYLYGSAVQAGVAAGSGAGGGGGRSAAPATAAAATAAAAAAGVGGGGGGGGAVDVLDEQTRLHFAAQMLRLRRDLDDRRSEWQSGSVTQKHRPPSVLYAVGTMIQHRTYGYRGVIVDWDTSCKMDQSWIAQMGVDALPGGGRHQPFYRILVSDRGRGRHRDRTRDPTDEPGGEAAAGGAGGRPARGGTGGGSHGGTPLQALGGRQLWRPDGPGSHLQGLHNRPKAEETYVAQVNIHVIVPQPAPDSANDPNHSNHQRHQLRPQPQPQRKLPPEPEADGGAAGGIGVGKGCRCPGAVTAAASTMHATAPAGRPTGPYDHLRPLGVITVSVPYDFEVQHPELGRYFEGKRPGALRYRLNAAMRHRFPGDDDGWDGWEEGDDEGSDDEDGGHAGAGQAPCGQGRGPGGGARRRWRGEEEGEP